MKNFVKRLALVFGVCFCISILGVIVFLISKIPYIEIIIVIVLVPFVLIPVLWLVGIILFSLIWLFTGKWIAPKCFY